MRCTKVLRVCALMALALLVREAAAWTPLRPDVRQKEWPSSNYAPIDHLEPASLLRHPGMREDYYLAKFIMMPSFRQGGIWRIIVRDQKHVLQSWVERDRRFVDSPVNKASLQETEVPEKVARLVYEMFANALLEVRHSRTSSIGMDGTTYYFSTFVRGMGWMHGETWSPDAELPPKWMTDCGEMIYAYSRVPQGRDMALLTVRLQKYHGRLHAYWRRHGRH